MVDIYGKKSGRTDLKFVTYFCNAFAVTSSAVVDTFANKFHFPDAMREE